MYELVFVEILIVDQGGSSIHAGIRTEQYLFNFVYEHTNKEGKKFGEILSKSEIDFVSRFVLVAVYLHKLETDMRKAGDHLQENIRL